MSSYEKIIKDIAFAGKNFKIWSRKFLVQAYSNRCHSILKDEENIPKFSEHIASEARILHLTSK